MQEAAMIIESKWYISDSLNYALLPFSPYFFGAFLFAINLNSVDIVKYPKAINSIFYRIILLV